MRCRQQQWQQQRSRGCATCIYYHLRWLRLRLRRLPLCPAQCNSLVGLGLAQVPST